MQVKKCSKCSELKSLSEFHKRGLRYKSICKNCRHQEYILDSKNAKERTKINRKKKPDLYKKMNQLYREKTKERRNLNAKKRRSEDPIYRIRHNLRMRLNRAVKGIAKSAHTMELLGCTIDFFMSHLSSQFQENMTWENYGKWHIDHIRPCKSFDMTDESQQRECFHWSNMQPLWAIDNIIKSSKII